MDYFQYKSKSLPDSTIELTVTVPWQHIKTQYDNALLRISEKTKIQGFRPGKAPLDLVKKQTKEADIYEELVNKFIPSLYTDVLKITDIRPYTSPNVELKSAKPETDWEIVFKVAPAPTIELPDYKKLVQKLKSEQKSTEIWTPGKDEAIDKDQLSNKDKLTNHSIESLLKETKLTLSSLITTVEVNQRLARLVDDVQKLGMTVETYLSTKQLTLEKYRENLEAEIADIYKLQLLLETIGDKENIVVADAELDELINKAKGEDKTVLEQNKYIYSSILRRFCTLDFLLSL